MSPAVMNGPSGSQRGRADPHSPVVVTRMIASVGSLMIGSGTSSTLMCFGPCQVTARMLSPSSVLGLGHPGHQRRGERVRQMGAQLRLDAVLRRPGHDAALAGHQGLEAVGGHLSGVVLLGLADLGVLHVRSLEELG